MKIHTPKISIFSSNSDRQSIFDRALTRMHNLSVGSVVGGLAGAIGLRAGLVGILAIGGSFSVQQTASAQARITNVNATYNKAIEQSFTTTKTASPCEPTTVGLCDTTSTTTFGKGTSNDLQIVSVETASGGIYSFRKLADSIRINRINNTIASGERQIIFFQAESSVIPATKKIPGTFNISSGAVSTMEAALLNQSINRGSDNIFGNAGSGNSQNFNNVERLDYIINSGVTPSTSDELDEIGFVVMDRGDPGSFDSYKIAPILTLSAGLPDTFGLPKVFAIKGETKINADSSPLSYVVMRLEVGATVSPENLRPSDTTTQSIGGHFVSLRDLGIKVGETIYGYSLLSPTDGPTTAANMNPVNSTNYPTGTKLFNGGIDLIAGGGIFSKNPLPVVKYTVSGNVFNDVSGNKLQDGAEPLVNGRTLALNAVLFDVTGNKVYAVSSVSATGSYSFGNVQPGSYTVILTTAAALVGGIMPTIALPTNWTTTGENLSGTVETTPATPDSKIAITVVAANITNLNFGIEQLPNTTDLSSASQPNPGGTTRVQVTTLAGTDPEDGALGSGKTFKIVTLPTNGTLYYNGTAVTAGQTIPSYDPTKLTIDPNDEAIIVTFTYAAIDAAGKEDPTPATVTIPFVLATAPPNLLLVKRITAVNGNSVNLSVDDNNPKWPDKYLKGAIDGGKVKPGDEVEYTIYFLSSGGRPVTNAKICDWVPNNTTFVPDAYGNGTGIQLAIGAASSYLTNVPDGDRGNFYPTGSTSLPTCGTPGGSQGAVVVNLDQLPNATAAGNPGNSYGFIRFVSKVK